MNDIQAILSAPNAPRALLVSLSHDGQVKHQPVESGASVLNIETELLDHLSDGPVSTKFLQDLQAYCTGRLAARKEAGATGGVMVPRGNAWEIMHAPAFRSLTVAV